MEKPDFSKEYIKFVEMLYKDNSSIITNKEFLSETVMMLRGLREGCPLSLPLCAIQGEVTTKNINNDNTIIGLKIPNSKKQLKISQYADDSNFFLQNQESVKNVLKYFQKLKEATGAIINLDCTTNKHKYNHKFTNWNHNKRPKRKYKNTRNIFQWRFTIRKQHKLAKNNWQNRKTYK